MAVVTKLALHFWWCAALAIMAMAIVAEVVLPLECPTICCQRCWFQRIVLHLELNVSLGVVVPSLWNALYGKQVWGLE